MIEEEVNEIVIGEEGIDEVISVRIAKKISASEAVGLTFKLLSMAKIISDFESINPEKNISKEDRLLF